MTEPRTDPGDWQALWTAEGDRRPAQARALEARVRREAGRMLGITAIQTVISAVILVLVGEVMLEHRDPFHLAWGAGVVVMVAGAWLFLVINRRGVWTPYAETTHAFLAVATERCHRRLRVVRGLTAFAVAHLVFTALLAWWGYHLRLGVPPHPADAATYAGAVIVLIGVILWAAWYRRRTLAELSQLRSLATLIA